MPRLSTFHTTSLRKIQRVFWPRRITNKEFLDQSDQENRCTLITRGRWRWICHVRRKDGDSMTRTPIRGTPGRKRRRGRPKTTWRTTVEAELKDLGDTWGTSERLARNRTVWRNLLAALNADERCEGSNWHSQTTNPAYL